MLEPEPLYMEISLYIETQLMVGGVNLPCTAICLTTTTQMLYALCMGLSTKINVSGALMCDIFREGRSCEATNHKLATNDKRHRPTWQENLRKSDSHKGSRCTAAAVDNCGLTACI